MLCHSLAVLVQALSRRSSSVDHKAPAPHVLNVEIRRGNVVCKVCTVVVCVVMWCKLCWGVVWWYGVAVLYGLVSGVWHLMMYDVLLYMVCCGIWCVVVYGVCGVLLYMVWCMVCYGI